MECLKQCPVSTVLSHKTARIKLIFSFSGCSTNTDLILLRGSENFSDCEMDARAVEAVKAAINKAKVCKKPVAGYDKERKAAYLEYANGERKYAE